MNGTFYAFNADGEEILVDTTDVQISPNGYSLLVKIYSEKRLNRGDKGGIFQGYLTIGKCIPEGKRKEFSKKCREILSEYRNKKIKTKRKEKKIIKKERKEKNK
jgi:hypothetical protein